MNAKQLWIFILLSVSAASAQVFIPFGFYKALDPLSVSPSSPLYLQPSDLVTLTGSGKTGFYSWSISGAASADGATITTPGVTADYEARSTAYTTDTITMTSIGSLNILVTTFNSISISPTSATVAVSTTQDFSVSGGLCVVAPATTCSDPTATWNITSGGASGSVDANGLFTATAIPGPVTLEVSDAIGNTGTATITVTNTLSISPTTMKLGLYSTGTFSGTLGTLPYTFSVFAGSGSVGCRSTLTGTHNTVVTTINVTSTAGCSPVGVVRIGTEDVCYTAMTGTTFTGATRGCNSTVAASYTAGQSFNSTRAVYTAPSLIGSATVRVTDAGANTSDANVSVIRPTDIKVGAYFACVLYDEGSVKCWGTNGSGQLGIGSTATIGDIGGEVGGANSFVDLGTGRTAAKIYTGSAHACAILDNNQTKCWGAGGNGRLGYGNTQSKGDAAGEMGDNLIAVDLGTGRFATMLALGGTHTCALLDDSTVKCWGSGTSGRLGYENSTSRGDGANEMGDSLPAVNLGTGRTATKIIAGLDFTCALLDNALVKCWGENQRGQLGRDNTTDWGLNVSEMGDGLAAVNIGAGRTALDLVGSYETVCVERDNNTAICWGRNNRGQTGRGSTGGNIGDAGGEMAAIASINFGGGFGTLSEIFPGGNMFCAKDTLNVTKCWGTAQYGQQLAGNTTNVSSPATINWGTGLVLSKLHNYFDVECALFSNDKIKCWGRARTGTAGVVNGVLMNGSTENSLGDAAGEVGDFLNFINH